MIKKCSFGACGDVPVYVNPSGSEQNGQDGLQNKDTSRREGKCPGKRIIELGIWNGCLSYSGPPYF